jgi:hypothetical protein
LISGVVAVPTASVALPSANDRDEEFVPPVNKVVLLPMVRPCPAAELEPGAPVTLFNKAILAWGTLLTVVAVAVGVIDNVPPVLDPIETGAVVEPEVIVPVTVKLPVTVVPVPELTARLLVPLVMVVAPVMLLAPP